MNTSTKHRWRRGAVACGAAAAVSLGSLATAGTASAAENVPYIGPDSTSLELNGYPGFVGNSGFAVECVQRALLAKPDGDYGQETYEAIKTFQKLHGLEVDGVVGPQTGDRLIPSLPDAYKDSCYDVIPTTQDLRVAEVQPIVPGSTVREDDFMSCMKENGTGIDGLLKLGKIRKLYKLLKVGKKVDGAEIARTVPGTDLIMMFSCLRYGPPS
ncbi:peptidoglycan-binding domain-containing protein [Actinomycetospora soli]|uniref:peptidoglycan-binding domain-containing protein n=1 Tax=Actinomycetospora soli TaxID=2893887 RepID=UPI001E365378|nr:peptidoglycan-binding domain-containing protein [Actinomycetospora soli]MCD2187846.1 peptidoglycan-binding protein [Actinomycetospora soli]